MAEPQFYKGMWGLIKLCFDFSLFASFPRNWNLSDNLRSLSDFLLQTFFLTMEHLETLELLH